MSRFQKLTSMSSQTDAREAIRCLEYVLNMGEGVLKAQNLGYRVGSGTIYEEAGTLKIRLELRILEGKDGKLLPSEEALAWEQHVRSGLLEGVKVGDTFENSHGTYRILGWRPRARTNKILAEDTRTKKQYVFTVKAVQWALNGSR